MISGPFIASLSGGLAIFAVAGVAFAIGKYNYFVSLRGRITSGLLQMDLALRKQAAEMRALGSSLPKGEGRSSNDLFDMLDRAEKSSHHAVAGRLCDANLAELALADRHIATCWSDLVTAGAEEVSGIARNRMGLNAEMREHVSSLIVHYNRRISTLSGRWAAKAFGFENLTGAAFVERCMDTREHGL